MSDNPFPKKSFTALALIGALWFGPPLMEGTSTNCGALHHLGAQEFADATGKPFDPAFQQRLADGGRDAENPGVCMISYWLLYFDPPKLPREQDASR